VKKVSKKILPNSEISYFQQRLNELGLTHREAFKNGLYEGEGGSIEQRFRTFDGEEITFTPQYGKKAEALKKISKRGSYAKHEKQFYAPLAIIRHTPQQIESGLPRYKFPSKNYTGFSPLPMPSNKAIEAFTEQKKGGTIVFTEGYFKAVTLSKNGLESVAFSSITTYKLTDSVKRYLLSREAEVVVVQYDGDAMNIKRNKDGIYSSNRLQMFFNSAVNFSNAFYKFCEAEGLKTKLHWCMVNKDLPQKGIDDLINASGEEEKKNVLEVFNKLENSQYFTFEKLFRTTTEKRLLKHFALSNHRTFYAKYKDLINKEDFIFNGFKYGTKPLYNKYNLFNKVSKSNFFHLKENPHKIEVEEEVVEIEKYLNEKEATFRRLMFSKKLAIEAPTGSAKTSFYIGYKKGSRKRKGYFQKYGIKAVVAVPYISLAKQLVKSTIDSVALYGSVNHARKEAAINATVVICTYDTLHHVADLSQRVLVVDEAHNLINHFGQVNRRFKLFRAATLRRTVEAFEKVKQTILISGTMPKMLCNAFGFKYVKVKRKVNPLVKIKAIEAESSTPEALTKAAIQELQKINFKSNRIHFALYDNVDQVETIKAAMVKSGKLTANDIDIITRSEINKAEKIEAYKQIIKDGIIKGKKLILCTCLIAEGISINNKNIGNIFCIGVKCVDKFRQFVARYRKLSSINVTSILPPEKRMEKVFKYPSELKMENEMETALHQLNQYKKQKAFYVADYEKEDLPYLDYLKPSYQYKQNTLKWLYVEAEEATVDTLKILASIREDVFHYSNNAFFYTQLLEEENFFMDGMEEAVVVDDKTTEIIEAAKAEAKDERTAATESLKDTILNTPSIITSAYYLHLKKTKNRHGLKFISTIASNLIEENMEAEKFYNKNKKFFSKRWYINLIRAFLSLQYIGIDAEEMVEEITKYKEAQFAKKWKAFLRCMDLIIYESKRKRKHLSTIHKIDIKFTKHLKKKIMEVTNDVSGVITTNEVKDIINSFFRFKEWRKDYSYKNIQLDYFTKGKVESLVESLFNVEVINRSTDGKTYLIKNEYLNAEELQKGTYHSVPFCSKKAVTITLEPLKTLVFYTKKT